MFASEMMIEYIISHTYIEYTVKTYLSPTPPHLLLLTNPEPTPSQSQQNKHFWYELPVIDNLFSLTILALGLRLKTGFGARMW